MAYILKGIVPDTVSVDCLSSRRPPCPAPETCIIELSFMLYALKDFEVVLCGCL